MKSQCSSLSGDRRATQRLKVKLTLLVISVCYESSECVIMWLLCFSVERQYMNELFDLGFLKYTPSREVEGKRINSYDDR